VRWVTNSCWAIWRLVWPSAASATTRRSAGGQRVAARERCAARPGARGAQLLAGARGEPHGAAAVGEVQRGAQRLARRLAPAAPAQRRAELHERAHVLELRRAVAQERHRALERRDRLRGRRAAGERAQRGAERPAAPKRSASASCSLASSRAAAGRRARQAPRRRTRASREAGAVGGVESPARRGSTRVREGILGAPLGQAQPRAGLHHLREDQEVRREDVRPAGDQRALGRVELVALHQRVEEGTSAQARESGGETASLNSNAGAGRPPRRRPRRGGPGPSRA
jgi:hypothetical protein